MGSISIIAVTGSIATVAALAQPVAAPDTLLVRQCAEATIDVLLNDHDLKGTPLLLQSISPPSRGTAEIRPPGTIFYKAGPETGADVIVYVVRNSVGEPASGTVNVVIEPGDDCS